MCKKLPNSSFSCKWFFEVLFFEMHKESYHLIIWISCPFFWNFHNQILQRGIFCLFQCLVARLIFFIISSSLGLHLLLQFCLWTWPLLAQEAGKISLCFTIFFYVWRASPGLNLPFVLAKMGRGLIFNCLSLFLQK